MWFWAAKAQTNEKFDRVRINLRIMCKNLQTGHLMIRMVGHLNFS